MVAVQRAALAASVNVNQKSVGLAVAAFGDAANSEMQHDPQRATTRAALVAAQSASAAPRIEAEKKIGCYTLCLRCTLNLRVRGAGYSTPPRPAPKHGLIDSA